MIPTFHWWRTVVFLVPVISVYTVVLGALSLASSLFDRRGHVAHWCARCWSWLILATTGVEVHVEGLERLESGRTYVFVANHQSIYDIPVLFASLPFQLRIIAKDALGRFPILGAHLKRTGHLLVNRRKPDRAAVFAWASALTGKGLSLIVFPEGTRSRDGMVGVFKGGSFFPAMQAGLPVVPLSVVGSRHVMRKGELTTRPGHVTLVVHAPIQTTAHASPSADEVRSLASHVRDVVRATVEAEAQGAPSPPPRASIRQARCDGPSA